MKSIKSKLSILLLVSMLFNVVGIFPAQAATKKHIVKDKKPPVIKSFTPSTKKAITDTASFKFKFSEPIYKGKYYSKISLEIDGISVTKTVSISSKYYLNVRPGKNELYSMSDVQVCIPAGAITDKSKNRNARITKNFVVKTYVTNDKEIGDQTYVKTSKFCNSCFGEISNAEDVDMFSFVLNRKTPIQLAGFTDTDFENSLSSDLLDNFEVTVIDANGDTCIIAEYYNGPLNGIGSFFNDEIVSLKKGVYRICIKPNQDWVDAEMNKTPEGGQIVRPQYLLYVIPVYE